MPMLCPFCKRVHDYDLERCLAGNIPGSLLDTILPSFIKIISDTKVEGHLTSPQVATMGLLFICLDYYYTELAMPVDRLMNLVVALLEKVAQIRGDDLRINLEQEQVSTLREFFESAIQDKSKGN